MKSKYVRWVLLSLLICLLVMFTGVSCKSTPPVEEPASADSAAPDQAAIDALNAAAARAAAARKLVNDFDGPTLFPSDWQAAESLYSQAEQQKKTSTTEEIKESTARYNKAADAFDAMRDKTLAGYYENKQNELIRARSAAVSAGAYEYVPEYLLEVDNLVAEAEKKYQAKDYYGANDDAKKALSMYEAGAAGLEAYRVREVIADRDFEKYDRNNVSYADDALMSAADDYVAGDFAAAKDKADEALLRYNLALKTAWQAYAGEKGAQVSAERQRALDAKANVAVREDFNSAQAVYTRANTAFQGQRFEEASLLYDECGPKFGAAARAAAEKRQAAETALRRAEVKMAEADQIAKDAEVILEGGIE